MSCPGLHCPGCSGGQSLAVLGGLGVAVFAAYKIVPWVADRIWWIGGTVAVSVALSAAACLALAAWTDRRTARFAAYRAAVRAREVPEVVTVTATPIPSAERPALGFRDLHIHLDGVPTEAQAAVIRQALNGRN